MPRLPSVPSRAGSTRMHLRVQSSTKWQPGSRGEKVILAGARPAPSRPTLLPGVPWGWLTPELRKPNRCQGSYRVGYAQGTCLKALCNLSGPCQLYSLKCGRNSSPPPHLVMGTPAATLHACTSSQAREHQPGHKETPSPPPDGGVRGERMAPAPEEQGAGNLP